MVAFLSLPGTGKGRSQLDIKALKLRHCSESQRVFLAKRETLACGLPVRSPRVQAQRGPALCVSRLISNLEAPGMPASPPPEVVPHRDHVLAADSLRVMGDGRDLDELRRQVS